MILHPGWTLKSTGKVLKITDALVWLLKITIRLFWDGAQAWLIFLLFFFSVLTLAGYNRRPNFKTSDLLISTIVCCALLSGTQVFGSLWDIIDTQTVQKHNTVKNNNISRFAKSCFQAAVTSIYRIYCLRVADGRVLLRRDTLSGKPHCSAINNRGVLFPTHS